MKKSILGIGLIATTVLVGVTSVDAAKDALNGETEVGIGFSKDTVTPGPYMNNLTLVRYPSAFNFGLGNKVSSQTAVFPEAGYKVVADDEAAKADENAQFLGVFDDRKTNLDKGWKLTAKLSDLTVDGAPATEDNRLNGFMEMRFSSAQKWNITEKNSNNSDYIIPNPRAEGATSELTNAAKYDLAALGLDKKVKLDIGSAAEVDIMGAKDEAEAARGGIVTSAHEVQLTVNSGAKDESAYAGKIDWKLSTAYQGN